jgi:BirA family biotin operon repressor/biotin-[acetyl-CoA-carboxylase] ligase
LIRIERIMAQLETEYVGREVHYFQKLSSTNTVAKEQAEKGGKEGTTVIAETQTAGKGRLDRRWISPKGGIWLSVILRPEIGAEEALKITLTTAVAVAKTLRKLYGLNAEIKWPNDVLVDGKKVCGILTEAKLTGKEVNFIVVGVGINANFTTQTLPKELQTATTTLEDVLGKKVDKERLICGLLKEFEDHYNLFKEEEYGKLLDEWRGMAGILGKEVEITGFGESFRCKVVDVNESGALIVELKNGERRRILAGDVTVRRV